MRRTISVMAGMAGLVLVLTAAGAPCQAGRYEQFTAAAAKGPHAKVASATLFGGKDLEWFVAAGELSDGRVVAVGSAAGPSFPDAVKPTVLGKGTHRGLDPWVKGRKGRSEIGTANPDLAGFWVVYKPGLSAIEKVFRFDWGVASIEQALLVPKGGSLIVAGRCTDAMDKLLADAGVKAHVQPSPGGRAPKPVKYDGKTVDQTVYVAKLDADSGKIAWLWKLRGYTDVPEKLWADDAGNVYFELHGFTRIAADGTKLSRITEKGSGGRAGVRMVDPADGTFYFGGDRNTHTGREPWRQPFLYRFSPTGQKQWTAWEWNSRRVGTGQYRLVSDSAVRASDIGPEGDLIVGGWSDGGNSVFTRQPDELNESAGKSALGFSAWGMKNANSLAYVMRVDPKTRKMKAWTLWVGYIPEDFASPKYRNAPNGVSIRDLEALPHGPVAISGTAGTGLIQTPEAFFKYPKDGSKHGGWFVTVMPKGLDRLLFSSYLPGVSDIRLAEAAKARGVLVAGRCDGQTRGMGDLPLVKPLRADLGGKLDGYLMLLTTPR